MSNMSSCIWEYVKYFSIIVTLILFFDLGHRRMQNVTNYFLVNLSCADLMMSCLNTSFNFTFMKSRWVPWLSVFSWDSSMLKSYEKLCFAFQGVGFWWSLLHHQQLHCLHVCIRVCFQFSGHCYGQVRLSTHNTVLPNYGYPLRLQDFYWFY